MSSCRDLSKNMVARGQGLFSLYIYIENFKNLPVIKNLANFNIPWQECFLVTLYHDCSGSHDSSKIMAAWWWEVPISLYRKLHHRIVKNHWTNLILLGRNVSFVTYYQDCPSNRDSSKNDLYEGSGGADFPYISIKKTLKGGPGVSLCCFVVYSTRRFVICLSVCHFVLVFFSSFSIAITSPGEERANLRAFRTFVRFVLV